MKQAFQLLRPGLLIFSLACFLLPFVNVSCNQKIVQKAKGYELAFGRDSVQVDENAAIKANMDEGELLDKKSGIKKDWYVLSAFICLAAALALSFFANRYLAITDTVLTLAGFVLLAVFYVVFKKNNETNGTDKMLQVKVVVDVSYQLGFYLAGLFSLLATFANGIFTWLAFKPHTLSANPVIGENSKGDGTLTDESDTETSVDPNR